MKRIKVSLALNIAIVILVLLASIFMFAGIKFMPDKTLLELSKVEMFKFYTVDSTILLGIISLIISIYEIKLLKNKINEIPKTVYILKFIATSGITLTMLVTLLFLVPQYGIYAMYSNNNLFLHLIVPLLALISYIFFEKYDNKYSYSILGIIPMFIYSIYYMSQVLIHINDGGLTIKYDFYGFLQGNLNNIYIVIPIMYLFSYLIATVLITFNKKIK